MLGDKPGHRSDPRKTPLDNLLDAAEEARQFLEAQRDFVEAYGVEEYSRLRQTIDASKRNTRWQSERYRGRCRDPQPYAGATACTQVATMPPRRRGGKSTHT